MKVYFPLIFYRTRAIVLRGFEQAKPIKQSICKAPAKGAPWSIMIPTGLFTAVIPPLDGEYLYRFDPNTGSLLSGFRLELPFGRRSTTGFVLSVDTEKEKIAYSAMKEIGVTVKQINVEGATLAYQSEQFSLMDWMARYYGEPLSKILDLAVPNSAHEKKDLYYLLNEGQELGNLGKAQQKLVDFLRLNNSQAYASEIRAALGNCSATLTSLLKRQILTVSDDAIQRLLEDHENFANHPEDVLNEAQLTAGTTISSAVAKHEFLSFLLHGVTGSGKTEVYMHAIRTALESNRGSLVIVPEIALTPQLVERFERKVGAAISLLHSSLKPRERWANWVKLLNGDVKIALGARSAIFAPVKDLGLIVVDEEHDGSFKQGEGIRYNARDLALVRGKMSSCPVVLGSATPSLETFYNTVNNRHINLSLPGRFHNSKKLKYSLIDLNKLKPWEMPSKSISPELVALIQDTLDKQEQAFILYNRRGFASYMQCTHCEHVIKCPHCSVTLTYHQRPVSLLCHFCGYSSAPLIVCPSCHKAEPKESKHGIQSSSPFALRGGGTERVFEELQALFPKARMAKLDRDTAHSISDYTDILGRVRRGEVDILVGTQMIAKGHDLPDVTFVGVVDCDVGLHMPDFRASERIFQLLTQVAGRAGRREKQGHVALQTRLPQHPSIAMTIREDYLAFAHHELKERQILGHPPFNRLLRIIVSAEERNAAQMAAHQVGQVAHPLAGQYQVRVLGPVAAPIEKVRKHWRFHLIIKSDSAPKLQAFMKSVRNSLSLGKEIRITFDMDPQDMM